MTIRALHYVLKIGNRREAVEFYTNVLKMKVLRHEEFHEGCKAYCNGPYDGKWSKTMIGYGPEDDHFVLELTYNYGIGAYRHGNDFRGIHIHSPEVFQHVSQYPEYPMQKDGDRVGIVDPAGYKFFVHNKKSTRTDPIDLLELSCSDLKRSKDYWSKKCGMTVLESSPGSHALLTFGKDQCQLLLTQEFSPIDRAQSFGRVAFACPREELAPLQDRMDEDKETILTRLISLDTPGKATVEVVILADPDGHEICFVGDEAFRSLSEVDPAASERLAKAMDEDKSAAWFGKRGGKPVA